MANQKFSLDPVQKLLARVKKTDSCWLWLPKNGIPYGQFYHEGKRVLAHRAVYEALVGKIPKGYVVHHVCNNPACVNPEHLKAVTQFENVHESKVAVAALNARKTHCKNGHPFSGDNLYIPPKRKDRRDCVACRKESGRKYRINLKKEVSLG